MLELGVGYLELEFASLGVDGDGLAVAHERDRSAGGRSPDRTASLRIALLREFRIRFPGVRLTLREAMGDVQLEELKSGKLSAGFVAAPVSSELLSHLTVLRETMVAVLPKSHTLARAQGAVRLAQLAREPFILFPRTIAPGLFDRIVAFGRAGGFSPRVEQEAMQSQTIVGLVSAGLGVAIVPASIKQLRRPGVVYRPFKERSPRVETLLVWRRETARPRCRIS